MQPNHPSIFAQTRSEIRSSLTLATPIILGQVGQMAMNLADTAMVGRVGVLPLAGAAFANNIILVIFMIGMNICTPIHVMVGYSLGNRKPEETSRTLLQGMWVAGVYALVCIPALWYGRGVLHQFGQPEEVVVEAIPYIFYNMVSMVPLLLFQVCRNFSEAWNRPWIPFNILAVGVLLNVLLNWVFIYGHWGMPAMGLDGAGLATAICRTLVCLGMGAVLIRNRCFGIGCSRRSFLPEWPTIKRILVLGIPCAFQSLFEMMAFNLASLMMGWLGAASLAANQIALNYAYLTYMVPAGMAYAVSIRVGEALGRRDMRHARLIGFSGVAFAVAFMGISGIIAIALNDPVAQFFCPESEAVWQLAAKILIVVGIWQVFDGTNALSLGALRGLGDVRYGSLLTFFIFWLGALPFAWLLGFQKPWGGIPGLIPPMKIGFGYGGVGVWSAMALGLAISAIILAARFWRMTRRMQHEFEVGCTLHEATKPQLPTVHGPQ